MNVIAKVASVTLPLKGLRTARRLYCDGLAEIQYAGVNALYIPYSLCRDETGQLVRNVSFTVHCPIGAMPDTDRQLREFMTDHFLNRG